MSQRIVLFLTAKYLVKIILVSGSYSQVSSIDHIRRAILRSNGRETFKGIETDNLTVTVEWFVNPP